MCAQPAAEENECAESAKRAVVAELRKLPPPFLALLADMSCDPQSRLFVDDRLRHAARGNDLASVILDHVSAAQMRSGGLSPDDMTSAVAAAIDSRIGALLREVDGYVACRSRSGRGPLMRRMREALRKVHREALAREVATGRRPPPERRAKRRLDPDEDLR